MGHANLFETTVATAPSPATSGTSMTITSATGAPAVPFFGILCPASTAATMANAELVEVTAMSGTSVTAMTRAQGGTSARTVVPGDRFYHVAAAVEFDRIPTATEKTNLSRLDVKSADIASATTTDLSTATGGFAVITGTTPITGLGTMAAGVEMVTLFDGSLTLTHNATSLICMGGANIQTQANDIAVWRSLGSGNWVMIYYKRFNAGFHDRWVATVTNVSVSSSNAENALITKSVPAGLIQSGRVMWGHASIHFTNSTGGTVTLTFNLKLAGSTIYGDATTTIPSSATNRPLWLEFVIVFLGTASQHGMLRLGLGNVNAAATGIGDLSTGPTIVWTFGGTNGLRSIDMSAAQNVELTVTHSSNSASCITLMELGVVEVC